MASIRTLGDGHNIHTLAFGTGKSPSPGASRALAPASLYTDRSATANRDGPNGDGDCSASIYRALRTGFRHFDTAASYGNEASIGKAVKQWTSEGHGNREDLTLTTKWGFSHDPNEEHDADALLQQSLLHLGVDYIDLMLMHHPHVPPYTLQEAWKKMIVWQKEGKVRSIGVSNFAADHIMQLAHTGTMPAVNEIEFHPYCFSDPQVLKAVATCQELGIAIGAYTTLASLTRKEFQGGPVDEIVRRIAEDQKCTKAQVLLAWARQRTGGGPIVTTASTEKYFQETLDSLKVNLSDEQLGEIDRAGMQSAIRRRYALNVFPNGPVADRRVGGKL